MSLDKESVSHLIANLGFFHVLFWIFPSLFNAFQLEFIPMTGEELLDLFSPIALTIVYFLIFKQYAEDKWWQWLIFLFGIVLFIQGLAINSVANYFSNQPVLLSEELIDQLYFYDEILGHVLWGIGFAVIFELFTYLSVIHEKKVAPVTRFKQVMSGVLLGISMSLFAIEGQVVSIFLVLTVISLIFIMQQRRKRAVSNPLTRVLMISALFTLSFLLAWGVSFKGYPQLSELGVI